MYLKTKFVFSFLIIVFLFSFTQIFAHSGRTDSSGGHNCRVGSCAGTYHYHNGGSAYTPPAKTYTYVAPVCNKPDLTKVTGESKVSEVGCKQNVVFTWDKGVGDNQYSVGLSKTPGADPGPTADTTTRVMNFTDVPPGKWYVNVKGGNSCGWSSVNYWDIDVPQPDVEINKFSLTQRGDGKFELIFDAECSEQYSISPSVGELTQAQINQGYVVVDPQKDTTYVLTVSNDGKTKTNSTSVILPTPTPEVEVYIEEEESESNPEVEVLGIEDVESDEAEEQDGFWSRMFSRLLRIFGF